MWLPWDYAIALMLAMLVFSTVATRLRWRSFAAMADEVALISALYALWQVVGRLSVMQIDGAIERGQALWDWERSVFMPSEAWAQSLTLPYPLLVQATNLYYATVHVPAMGVFLAWAYFARRSCYGRWRWTLAISTAACLAVQLVPVAPPRLVPGLPIVDTPALYDQSVYDALGYKIMGQLQAMPSIHVGWAFVIGAATWQLGGTWPRMIGGFHFLFTFWAVAVTANHYWADGLVAMAFVAVGYAALGVLDRKALGVSPIDISMPVPPVDANRSPVGAGAAKE